MLGTVASGLGITRHSESPKDFGYASPRVRDAARTTLYVFFLASGHISGRDS
jgi:hypothetical protein